MNYLSDITNQHDYYPFGMLLPNRHESTNEYRYGFQGQEMDNEIKGEGNSLNYKYRMHDPRIGRFFAVDPLFKSFPFMSPYVFAGNDPVRFEDVHGMGPGDRVKKAKYFLGIKYSQKLNLGKENRTGTSKEALEYLDCSEMVCRVLASDGTEPKIQRWSTKILKEKLNDNTKYHKSNKPEVGDVFLWRNEEHGHTGIVTGVNENGTIEITHSANSKRGTVTDKDLKLSYFTKQSGWQGFYRPNIENPASIIITEHEKNIKWASEMIFDMKSKNKNEVFGKHINRMNKYLKSQIDKYKLAGGTDSEVSRLTNIGSKTSKNKTKKYKIAGGPGEKYK